MQEEFLNIQEYFCIFSDVFAIKRKFFPLFRRTGLADAVKNGLGAIHKKAMVGKDMLPHLAEVAAIHVDQPSAAGAFQMEVLAAIVRVLHVLVARAADLVDDVFSYLSALR